MQSQVKTLRLALPSNFLACPSLNIDIAPQLRCLIPLRIETAELTVGFNDIFSHSCAFHSLPPPLPEGAGFPCLHVFLPLPPCFSPRKLSTQRLGKVCCKPMAAPPVVTATHNRLHGHGLGVGSTKLWADRSTNSPGGASAQGASVSPSAVPLAPQHCPSRERSPLVARHHPLPGAARLLRVPVVHFLCSKLGVRLCGRS